MTNYDLKIIRVVDGAQYPRVSNGIADLIAGVHDLSHMEDRFKAEFLYSLEMAYDALQKAGWIEHTNDWDWLVQIETKDGQMFGDFCVDGVYMDEDDQDGPYCDEFHCKWHHHNFHFDSTPAYYQNLIVELPVETDDESGMSYTTKRIRVGDIRSITLTQR